MLTGCVLKSAVRGVGICNLFDLEQNILEGRALSHQVCLFPAYPQLFLQVKVFIPEAVL